MRRTTLALPMLALSAAVVLPAAAGPAGSHGGGAAQMQVFNYSTTELDGLTLTGDFPRGAAVFAGTVSLAAGVTISGSVFDTVRAVGPFPVTGSSADGSKHLVGSCSGTYSDNEYAWSRSATGNWSAVAHLTCSTTVDGGSASTSAVTITLPTSTVDDVPGGRGEETTFYGAFTGTGG